jgi:hypothetical protein
VMWPSDKKWTLTGMWLPTGQSHTIRHNNTDAHTERKQTEPMICCHINTHIYQYFTILTCDFSYENKRSWWWHIRFRNM